MTVGQQRGRALESSNIIFPFPASKASDSSAMGSYHQVLMDKLKKITGNILYYFESLRDIADNYEEDISHTLHWALYLTTYSFLEELLLCRDKVN